MNELFTLVDTSSNDDINVGEAMLHVCDKSYKLGFRDGKLETLSKFPKWRIADKIIEAAAIVKFETENGVEIAYVKHIWPGRKYILCSDLLKIDDED